MSQNLTADQVPEESVAAMPKPLGQIYKALHDEVAWLHIKWKSYRTLFGKNEETIALLNKTAPTFFGNLSQMMWEDTLLHLCRLTDSPKVRKYDLLTIQQLRSMVRDKALVKSVRQHINAAVRKTNFARDRRNRQLAHKELPLPTDQTTRPLLNASRQHVEDALDAIRLVMNTIEQHYHGSTVAYKLSIDAFGDAESLLAVLKRGAKKGYKQKKS